MVDERLIIDQSDIQDQIAYCAVAKQRLAKLTVKELQTLAAHLFKMDCRDWPKADLIENIAEEHAETVLSGGRWV